MSFVEINQLSLSHDSDGFPCYDDLYKIINKQIDNFNEQKPVSVSWLTDQQKMEAESIESIKDPSKMVTFHYTAPKLDYFKQVGSLSPK